MSEEKKLEDIEKQETKSEIQNEKKQKENQEELSIFINEEDTFDLKIRWYKKDKTLYVEEVAEDFDKKDPNINEFIVTFKYPSQGDVTMITFDKTFDNIDILELYKIEIQRLKILIRKWSLKSKLEIDRLDPNIVKAILIGIKKEIGLKGII